MIPITLTCADYARVMPLATGEVKPEGIALSRNGRMAFVTLQGSARLALIDIASASVVGYVPTGPGADGIGYSPFGR